MVVDVRQRLRTALIALGVGQEGNWLEPGKFPCSSLTAGLTPVVESLIAEAVLAERTAWNGEMGIHQHEGQPPLSPWEAGQAIRAAGLERMMGLE